MVDIKKRKRLAFHLRQLAVGLITNDEFEIAIAEEITDGWLPEQYYRSKTAIKDDPIIIPMLELCWGLYNETKEHRLTGSYKLSTEVLNVVSRCILFLRSNKEYEWSYFDVKPNYALLDFVLAILTLGYSLKFKRNNQNQHFLRWQQQGDYNVWPFICHNDYSAQLKHQLF